MTDSVQYIKIVKWSDDDQCFIGFCPGIIDPCCHGDDVYMEFLLWKVCDYELFATLMRFWARSRVAWARGRFRSGHLYLVVLRHRYGNFGVR